jgi:hypothetical protein
LKTKSLLIEQRLFLTSKRPWWVATWAAGGKATATTTATACAVAASGTAAAESTTTAATTAAGHAVYAGAQWVRLAAGVAAALVVVALVV